MKTSRMLAATALAVLLASCGTAPLQQDQPVYLAPGQGLAAVTFDTLDPLSQMVIEPATSGGSKLSLPSVPAGRHIYLFPVNAGRYCFTRFQYGSWNFFSKDQGNCFEVKAGELGYSGTLAPRVEDKQVYVHQVMDVDGFRSLMTAQYPIVAKQFLPAPVQPYSDADLHAAASQAPAESTAQAPLPAHIEPHQAPPAGNDQISSWIEEIPGTRADVIFFRNNTGWTMEVQKFELYDCVGVKQACGVQKFKLLLPPHVIKQAMVVEPDSPDDAYTFRTRYLYGFVQNPPPPPKKAKQHR